MVLCTAGILGCVGCSRPFIPDRFDPAAENGVLETMRNAPTVVVGVVRDVNPVGSPRPALRLPELDLQLFRAEILVEVVLKGSAPFHLVFWFYGPDVRQGLTGAPKFLLHPGERRLLFLTSERGRMRAVGDYLDHSIRIWTGTPKLERKDTQTLGGILSSILLEPTMDVDLEPLASDLFWLSRAADFFGSRSNSVHLLRSLLRHPDSTLRQKACRVLALYYDGQAECLADILRTHDVDPSSRASYEQMFIQARQRYRLLESQLATEPTSALTKMPWRDSRSRVLDELESIALTEDPTLRKAACRAVEQLYPGHQLDPCK
jgi:hypothetical protein